MNAQPKAWGFHMQFNNGRESIYKGLADLKNCEAHREAGETITMLYPAAEVVRLQAELEAMTQCAKNHDAARTKYLLSNERMRAALDKAKASPSWPHTSITVRGVLEDAFAREAEEGESQP